MKDAKNYFDNFFKGVDISLLSSHVNGCLNDVKEMIEHEHRKKYNIEGIFLSNQEDTNENQKITMLNWDEKFYFENPVNPQEEVWQRQIC